MGEERCAADAGLSRGQAPARRPAALPRGQMSETCARRLLRNATATKVKRFDSADYFMHQHLTKQQLSAVPCSAPSSAPCSAPSTAPSSARSDTMQEDVPASFYGEMELPALAFAEDMELELTQPHEDLTSRSPAGKWYPR